MKKIDRKRDDKEKERERRGEEERFRMKVKWRIDKLRERRKEIEGENECIEKLAYCFSPSMMQENWQ